MATANVSYKDIDGKIKYVEAEIVTSDENSWTYGWYVVNSDVVSTSQYTVNGDVNLILADGFTLTVTADRDNAGISVTGKNNYFTVYGQENGTGTLNANGGKNGAGIGGDGIGSTEEIDTNITINGGTINATGGEKGAGIGGGDSSPGTNITINGGTVTATGGNYASGIGGGYYGTGTDITINGGTVNANGGKFGAGIGGGEESNGSNITINGGNVTANGGEKGAGIGGGVHGDGSNIFIDTSLIVRAGNDNPPKTKIKNTGEDLATSLADKQYVTAAAAQPTVTYKNYKSGSFVDATIGGATGASYTLINADSASDVTWSAGFYVVGADYNKDGIIDATDAALGTNTFTISGSAIVSGNVKLILADGFTLTVTAGDDKAGISVTGKNTLIVYGQENGTGTLKANGGEYGAGIGGDKNSEGCNITINGGTINANGGAYASGIGGGSAGGSNITINGGTVTANGGKNASGIGGGSYGAGSDITINGGTVNANGGDNASGIGGGNTGNGTNITINGGTVTANSEKYGAGIGGGSYGAGSDITINGGTVNANGGDYASGIGGGDGGNGSNIKINDGTVTANGGKNVSGIGGGEGGNGSNIYIDTSLTVKAGNKNPPTTEISHKSTDDIASALSGKRYVTAIKSAKYKLISVSSIPNGDVIFTVGGSEVTEAEAGATVTVAGKEVKGYYVTGFISYDVTITDNTFTMPANAVSVMVNYAQYDERIVVDSSYTKENPYELETGKTYTCAPTTKNGGAVYVEADGNLTGADVTFADNTVTYRTSQGGAIYNIGTVTINSGATFTGNTAKLLGGAIYNIGTVTINGGATFSKNYAMQGTAIYNNTSATVTINGNAIFSGNIGNDGAIYNGNIATVTINGNAVFNGNTGGAVFNKGTFDFSGTMDLQTGADRWNNFANSKVNWDISALTAAADTVRITHFEQYINANDSVMQTITVKADQAVGDYVLATGDFNMTILETNKSTNFTVKSEGGTDTDITVNGEMQAHGNQGYKLALVESEVAGDDKLVLTVMKYDDRIVVDSSYTKDNPYVLETGKTYTCAPIIENGGAVYVKVGGNLTGTDVTFADNVVKNSVTTGNGYGGAINNNNGTVSLTNATFTGNTAETSSGAIDNVGTLTITGDATFTGNKSGGVGGAIANLGTMTIDGGATFTNNSAENGVGGAINNKNTLTFNGNATFSNNTATGKGGAIYNNCGTVSFAGTMDLATDSDTWDNMGVVFDWGTSIEEHYSTTNWNLSGGLKQYGSIKNFQRYSIVYNDGSEVPGYSVPGYYSKQTITVSDTQEIGEYILATGDMTDHKDTETIKSGKYTFYATVDGKTLSEAITLSTTAENPVIFEGYAYSLVISDSDTPDIATDDKLVLTVMKYDDRIVVGGESPTVENPYELETGKTYTAKPSSVSGGALYVETDGIVTGTDVTFADNTVTGNHNGGAIFNKGNVTIKGATFTGNKAGAIGGAIYNNTNSTLTINDGATFTGNETGRNGGAINNNEGTFTINGGATFTGNKAKMSGGAICNKDGSTLTINGDATFTGNTTEASGGAIANTRGTLTINGNATFTGNKAELDGGAIFNNKTISFNGLMDLQTSTDTWYNKSIEEISSETKCSVNWDLTGGLKQYGSVKGFQWYSNSDASLVYQNLLVTSNQESGAYIIASGEGLTAEKLSANKSGDFNLKAGEDPGLKITIGGQSVSCVGKDYMLINANEKYVTLATGFTKDTNKKLVVYAEGGGTPSGTESNPYNINDTADLFQSISTADDGGALQIKEGAFATGSNLMFIGNKTKINGGAIYNDTNSTLTINDGATFVGNEATTGGAISNYNGTLTFNGGATFTGNVAMRSGAGAIQNRKNSTLTINGDAVFTGNTAAEETKGGAISNNNSTLTINGNAVFTGNKTTGTKYSAGGAIYNTDGTLTINGDAVFTGNESIKGGAIYNYRLSSLEEKSIVNFSGTITLATDSDTWVNYGEGEGMTPTVNWDITGGLEKHASIKNFQYYSNLTTTKQTVTVSATQAVGDYIIATGDMTDYAKDTTGKYTFYATADGKTLSEAITIGGGAAFNGRTYTLAMVAGDASDSKLVLTVKAYDSTAFVVNNAWSDKKFGDTVTVGGTDYVFGASAFSNTQAALNARAEDTVTISVDASTDTLTEDSTLTNTQTLKLNDTSLTVEDTKTLSGGTVEVSGKSVLVGSFGSTVTLKDGAVLGNGTNVKLTGDFTLEEKGTATFKDGAKVEKKDAFNIVEGNTLNIDNATVQTEKFIENKGTLNVKDATFDTGTFALINNGNMNVLAGTTTVTNTNLLSGLSNAKGSVLNLEQDAVLKFTGTKKITNSGTINLKGGMTAEDVAIDNSGTLNWDLTGETVSKIDWTNLLNSKNGTLTLTVKSEEEKGNTYTIASNASTAAGKNFTLTGVTGLKDVTISVGGTAAYNTWLYELKEDKGALNLTVLSHAEPLVTVTTEEKWFNANNDITLDGTVLDYVGTGIKSVVITGDGLTPETVDCTITSTETEGLYNWTGTFKSAETTKDGTVLTVTATDNSDPALAGKAEYKLTADGTGPVITVTRDPKADGTLQTSVTVTASAVDDLSGFDHMTYSVDGGETIDYTKPLVFTENSKVVFTAYDIVGNFTTQELFITDLEAITITAASASKVYDGTALSDSSYSFNEEALIAGDVLTATVEGSITNVGKAANVVTSYTIMRGAEDVTASYIFNDSVDGTLEVTRRDVTLKSASDTKNYDGTPLTNDTVTVSGSGWVEGEGATYDVTGSQTEVGSSLNTFDVICNKGTKAGNYIFYKEYGTLTVTNVPISNYNGTAQSDMIQFVNGLVYVTYDGADGKYVQTPAINDVTGWDVVEIRRDLTGDGLADVQITADDKAGSTWVAMLRNDYLTDGAITLNYQFIGAYDNKLWSYLGSADVNGDGKSEVLMMQTDAGLDGYGHRNVAAWVTDSEGKWVGNEWVGSLLSSEWSVAGTADVTGDGMDNVILRRADGMIGYWSEAGTNDIVEVSNAGSKVMLTSADFDGNGSDDLLFTDADGNFSTWSDLGSSGFFSKNIGNVDDLGGNWQFAGAGDYNGDGKDDLLWCDGNSVAYSEANKENFANLTIIA